MAAAPARAAAARKASTISGTNNQEQGVDEADLVKTDGYHVYTLNGNRLHIFGTPQFGDLIPESVTQDRGPPARDAARQGRRPRGRVLDDLRRRAAGGPSAARAHRLQRETASWYWRSSQLSKMTVLDISDRTQPRLIREVYYEGWYQTARKIDTLGPRLDVLADRSPRDQRNW